MKLKINLNLKNITEFNKISGIYKLFIWRKKISRFTEFIC